MLAKGLGGMLAPGRSSLETDIEAITRRLIAIEASILATNPEQMEQRIKTLEIGAAEEEKQARHLQRRIANLEAALVQDPLNVKVLEHRIGSLEKRFETTGSPVPKNRATKEPVRENALSAALDLKRAEEIVTMLVASCDNFGEKKTPQNPVERWATPPLPLDLGGWTKETPVSPEPPWGLKPTSPQASTSTQSDRFASSSYCTTPLSTYTGDSDSERSWGARHGASDKPAKSLSIGSLTNRWRQASKSPKAGECVPEMEPPLMWTPFSPKNNPRPGKLLAHGKDSL